MNPATSASILFLSKTSKNLASPSRMSKKYLHLAVPNTHRNRKKTDDVSSFDVSNILSIDRHTKFLGNLKKFLHLLVLQNYELKRSLRYSVLLYV